MRKIPVFFFLAYLIFISSTLFSQSATVEISFTLSDGVGGSKSIVAGLDPTATNNIDNSLGEEELPPLPPTFDARFNISSTVSTLKDIRNGTTSYVGSTIHEIQYQPSSGTNITISWNLPSGVTGNLQDYLGGIIYNQSFGSGPGSLSVTNATIINKLQLTLTYDGSLPVELISFYPEVQNNCIMLSWATATEINNYGFYIERKQLNEENWQTLGFVNGNGNSNSPKYYSFKDETIITTDTYFYRLKQVDFDGTYEYSFIIEAGLANPVKTELFQNYPNPFNPTTQIEFRLHDTDNVKLVVYDILGNCIDELLNTKLNAGFYRVQFDGQQYASGIYVYSLATSSCSILKKMIIMK